MSEKKPYYVEMRVRIALRKMKVDVSSERVRKEAGIIFNSTKKENRGVKVSIQDVIDALCAGEEVNYCQENAF